MHRAGALGIPGTVRFDALWQKLNISKLRDELRFYNTNLAPRVKYAFQALALEEARYNFQPAVWARPSGMPTVRSCSLILDNY